MSVIAHRKTEEISATIGRLDRAIIASAASVIVGFVRKTIVGIAKLFYRGAQTFAEARMQRAMIEAELYLNRYKHSSKNDNDLPIVR